MLLRFHNKAYVRLLMLRLGANRGLCCSPAERICLTLSSIKVAVNMVFCQFYFFHFKICEGWSFIASILHHCFCGCNLGNFLICMGMSTVGENCRGCDALLEPNVEIPFLMYSGDIR